MRTLINKISMKDFFKKAYELQDLIYSRALELYNASGGGHILTSRGLQFTETSVDVAYDIENDLHDIEYVTLTINQLEMSDSEWEEHISEIRLRTMERNMEKAEMRRQKRIEEKQMQIRRLEIDIESIKYGRDVEY